MLTKEQASCISASTGALMLEPKYFMEALSEKLGRKVYPQEFGDPRFKDEIKAIYADEFLELCWEPPPPKLIVVSS